MSSTSRSRAEAEHRDRVHWHELFADYALGAVGAVVIGLGEAVVRTHAVVESADIAYRAPAWAGVVAVARLAADPAAVVRANVEQGEAQVMDVCVELSDLDGRSTGERGFRIALRPRRST